MLIFEYNCSPNLSGAFARKVIIMLNTEPLDTRHEYQSIHKRSLNMQRV